MHNDITIPKIGLLATGDELTIGDILNSNGQFIAQQLTIQGYSMGQHLTVADQQTEIEQALRYLLQHHHIIIITGGLGPTSDDRTRFAVSTVIQKGLVFDEHSWQAITERFAHYNLSLHASNRQQALFPQDAHILPNPHGTAAGCYIEHQQRLIFLLPGPPKECLPMFEHAVLPIITQRFGVGNRRVLRWRLFGVVEADIAARLDHLTQLHACTTGYRIDYPYLEFKLYYAPGQDLAELISTLNTTLEPYHINKDNLTASTILIKTLTQYPKQITIFDYATAGALENLITGHYLAHKIIFNKPETKSDLQITINGLADLWQPSALNTTQLTLCFKDAEAIHEQQASIPLRNQTYTLKYVIEYLAYKISYYLGSEDISTKFTRLE